MKLISTILLLFSLFSISAYSQKTGKVDLAQKIRDATPAALPQTPVVEKLRSDAQDENLKGKVKSVIEDTLQAGKTKRERSSERYFNETGNLLREISYEDGYPTLVTVWGYIDGKRVSKAGYVEYAEGERPPSDDIVAVMDEEQEAINPNTPRDSRYGSQFTYKYDEKGRLIEKWTYQNNGEVWSHTKYVYTKNQREVSSYGRDGSRWTQGFEVLDKDGNIIEQFSMSDGKIEDNTIYTYQFDAQGNWIVEKAFEKKKVKGKIVRTPLWTNYRTITYYP